MQNRGITILFTAASIAAIACGGGSGTNGVVTGVNTSLETFRATMNGPSEVPATTSAGTGTFVATLDTVTNIFTYDITFTGLTSAAILAHIHGPATTTQGAGAMVDFGSLPGATFDLGMTAGKGHGALVLNASNSITAGLRGDSLRKLLFAGLTYVNIHTANNAGGEIRGQITK
jgi:CHRD domain